MRQRAESMPRTTVPHREEIMSALLASNIMHGRGSQLRILPRFGNRIDLTATEQLELFKSALGDPP